MISVIIPTHNRATTLEQAVRSALAQNYLSDDYEILIVDNASTDGTANVADKFRQHHNVRYVYEGQLGLHNARHAGARAAHGDILVFTDDDATFDESWVKSYADAFIAHPEMAAAGGPVREVWEVVPPSWLTEYVEECGGVKMFPALSLMEPYQEFRLGPDGYFFGVNMAIRRDVLFEVRGFNPESFANLWLGDGETGLNKKLWDRGMLIGYVPEAVVYHHIPPERMTVKYFRTRSRNQGNCDAYTRYHPQVVRPFAVARDLVRHLGGNAGLWIRTTLRHLDKVDRLSLEQQVRSSYAWGQACYMLRLIFSDRFREMVAKPKWLDS